MLKVELGGFFDGWETGKQAHAEDVDDQRIFLIDFRGGVPLEMEKELMERGKDILTPGIHGQGSEDPDKQSQGG